MSRQAETDLSGRWTGVYFYPLDAELNPFDTLPPTPFDAEIVDNGGNLSGEISEPDTMGPEPTALLRATMTGSHVNGEVVFTKHPGSPGDEFNDFEIPDAIEYLGTLSLDGNSISGRWHILDDWSGAFRMQRRTVEEAVYEEAPAEARH